MKSIASAIPFNSSAIFYQYFKLKLSMFSPLFQAILLTISGIIGAGIFALPYVFVYSNFYFSVIGLAFLTLVTILLNRFYIDVILSIRTDHQLPGYINIYLGPKFRNLAVLNLLISSFGALIAYIKLATNFLLVFFPAISPALLSNIFIIVIILLFFLRFRVNLSPLNYLPLLAIFIVLVIFSTTINLNLPPIPSFPPVIYFFGVTAFSLSGFTILPEVEELLRHHNQRSKLYLASLWSLLTVFVVYFIFSYSIARLSGQTISPDTISGLNHVSPLLSRITSIFGLLIITTISSSFINVIKEIFFRDLKLKLSLSVLLAISFPFFSYLLKKITFLEIISLVGSVDLFISTLLICLARLKIKRNPQLWLTIFFILFVFLAGLIIEFLPF